MQNELCMPKLASQTLTQFLSLSHQQLSHTYLAEWNNFPFCFARMRQTTWATVVLSEVVRFPRRNIALTLFLPIHFWWLVIVSLPPAINNAVIPEGCWCRTFVFMKLTRALFSQWDFGWMRPKWPINRRVNQETTHLLRSKMMVTQLNNRMYQSSFSVYIFYTIKRSLEIIWKQCFIWRGPLFCIVQALQTLHVFNCVIVITTSWPVHGSFEDTSEKKNMLWNVFTKNDNKIKIFFKKVCGTEGHWYREPEVL